MRQNLGDEESKKKKTRIFLTVVAKRDDVGCKNVAGECLVVGFWARRSVSIFACYWKTCVFVLLLML